MPAKNNPIRAIDKPGTTGTVGEPLVSTPATTNYRTDLLPSPTGLTVSGQNVYRSSASPMIAVSLKWNAAPSLGIDSFLLQYALAATFDKAETVTSYDHVETVILRPNTTYYARVASVHGLLISQYSPTLTFTTMQDTTIPPNPSTLTLEWSKGDLLITAPITDSEAVKNVRIRIYNQAQTVLIKEVDTAAPFLFTADENIRLTGGTATLTIVVHYRSWSDVLSASSVTQTTTSTAPGSITGLTSNWNGDTGTAAADLVVAWTADAQSSMYVVEFNNNAAFRYTTVDNEFNYTWEMNSRNSTPSGLYTMPVRVWGVNKLTQSGAVTTITHTNAAPTTTGATLTAFSGFSQIIGQLTHAKIDDVFTYQYTLIPASGTNVIYFSNSREVTLPIPSAGLWTLRANIIDRFGRASGNINSSQFFSDSLTISGLRSSATYDDSQSTNPATLNGLKDNVLTTSIVAHNNTTAGSRWTRMNRQLVDRYRTTTITTSGAMRFFLEYTADGSSFRYFGGPLTGTYGNTLTEYASLALAQTNFITHSGTITRYDLPSMIEARNIRMYHWTGAGSYGLAEFYPRRLVQSDDLEAESIKSINIAAGNVTADKIFVLNLAAINASTGNLTISGVLTIAASPNSGLYQGTGTFASPTTGLRIWRDGTGIGRLTTYSGGISQIDIDTSGRLTAGGGNVLLTSNGVSIIAPAGGSMAAASSVKWFEVNGTTKIAQVAAYYANTGLFRRTIDIGSLGGANRARLYLYANDSTRDVSITMDTSSNDLVMAVFGGTQLTLGTSDLAAIGSLTVTRTASAVSSEIGHIELHDSATPAKYLYAGWDANLSSGSGSGYVQSIFTGSSYYPTILNPLGGNVGINAQNNTPGRVLTLYNGSSTLIGFNGTSAELWSIGAEPASSNRFVIYNAALGYNFMINQSTGNGIFGINVAPSSTARFIVQGIGATSGTNAFAVRNGSGTNLMICRDDGAANLTIVNWALISAKSEKKNIKNDTTGLAELKRLRSKKYGLKRVEGADRYHGFIAEDFEEVFPDLVDEVEISEGEKVKGIRYGDLIPILVNAVQELSAEIDALKNKAQANK